jgi:hypothetical protein
MWSREEMGDTSDPDTLHTCHLPDGGRITVLERMTGFGWRDVETGYKSPCGRWYLASGQVDIRNALDELETHDDMAQWVIERANICTGSDERIAYRRIFPESFA